MNIGMNMYAYGGIPVEEQIALMKANGFTHTFLGSSGTRTREIVETLQKNGFELDTLHAPFDKINDMWLAGEDGDNMLSRLNQGVLDCADYNIPVLVVHLSSGEHPPIISEVGYHRFESLVNFATEKGVKIAFENQRKLGNLAYAFESFDDAGFCWDVGHETCLAPKPFDSMALFGDKLIALHLQDNTAEYNRDVHLIPGDGVIDMDKVALKLAKAKYNKAIQLEVIRHNSHHYDDWTAEQYYEHSAKAARMVADRVEYYKKELQEA